MADEISKHLAAYARDQLRVLGRGGRQYVRKCLILWETEYGAKVAEEVRGALNADRKAA